MNLSKSEIERVRRRIAPNIRNTPLLTCLYFDEMVGGDIIFKCENFQKTGSFKIRGASNAVSKLQQSANNALFTAHSSGNHGQALAAAARRVNAEAIIVMPQNAPRVKVEAVKHYGGQVVMCKANLEEREKTCKTVMKETGAVFIPPYDSIDIIEGQSTCAAELLQEEKNFDYILTPVGGGGLLSGSVLAAKALHPSTTVIGCEPAGADDAYQSMKMKKRIPQKSPKTVADGLRTSLGKHNFRVLIENNTQILTVSETEILDALRQVYERMKIVIEPSCAVPVAVLLKYKELFAGKKTGVILSGGNVDLQVFFNDLDKKITA